MAAGQAEPNGESGPKLGIRRGWLPAILAMAGAWALAATFAVLDLAMGLPAATLLLALAMTVALGAVVWFATQSDIISGAAPAEKPAEPEYPEGFNPSTAPANGGHHDALTGLPTFHPFSEHLLQEFQATKRHGKPLSVVLIDINGLADINKQFGDAVGDQALVRVAECLTETKRTFDVLARLGDDEFGLVLVDSGRDGAVAYVDRVYERLARDAIRSGTKQRPISVWVGVCAGVGTTAPGMTSADDLLAAAIDDLNAAKQERDRRRKSWRAAA
jgi:diguanylate cyclase (GGDEF)-like protein